MAHPRRLQCGVIGAGIAGLGAAIALSNAGHEVEVFERSRFKQEIGAAIVMCPNATKILERWGLHQEQTKPTVIHQIRILDRQDLQPVMRYVFDELAEKYDNGMGAYHRVDLHSGILEIAQQHSSVEIRLGTAVTKLDCDTGILNFADGGSVRKDFVVVADGIKSDLFRAVTGDETRTETTGQSVFRSLIPMDRLLADEEINSLFKDELPGFLAATISPQFSYLMTYPCREGQVLNLALFHITKDRREDADDWNNEATPEDALRVLEDFHPVWQKIVSKADSIKVHKVGYRGAPSRITNGKAVVIGDAAHPMLPMYAQGAAMALEDAAALEVILTGVEADENLNARLRVFEQLRLPRSATLQALSNAMITSKSVPTEVLIRKFYDGPLLDPIDAHGTSPMARDFCWNYDIFQEAQKALQFKDHAGGVPNGSLQYFLT